MHALALPTRHDKSFQIRNQTFVDFVPPEPKPKLTQPCAVAFKLSVLFFIFANLHKFTVNRFAARIIHCQHKPVSMADNAAPQPSTSRPSTSRESSRRSSPLPVGFLQPLPQTLDRYLSLDLRQEKKYTPETDSKRIILHDRFALLPVTQYTDLIPYVSTVPFLESPAATSTIVNPDLATISIFYRMNPAATRTAIWSLLDSAKLLDTLQLWLVKPPRTVPMAQWSLAYTTVPVQHFLSQWTVSTEASVDFNEYYQPTYWSYNPIPAAYISKTDCSLSEVCIYVRVARPECLQCLPRALTMAHALFYRVRLGPDTALADPCTAELIFYNSSYQTANLQQLSLIHAMLAAFTCLDEIQVVALSKPFVQDLLNHIYR